MSRRWRHALVVVLPAQPLAILDAVICIFCLGYWSPFLEFKWFGFALNHGLLRWAEKGKR